LILFARVGDLGLFRDGNELRWVGLAAPARLRPSRVSGLAFRLHPWPSSGVHTSRVLAAQEWSVDVDRQCRAPRDGLASGYNHPISWLRHIARESPVPSPGHLNARPHRARPSPYAALTSWGESST
jgi:hypothetical protein